MEKCILIIDDELITQKLLAMYFKKLGYQTIVASSAQEAMRLLQSESVDMITCDWMMPEINGLDFLRIRQENAEWKVIPTVMVSAASEDDELNQALEMGATAILRKPFTVSEIKEMAQSVLGAEL
ncbi:MAG: response regulator [Anaerolineaceae bacterium]|nr:response regulator [Anaerolineaceae bacterium]